MKRHIVLITIIGLLPMPLLGFAKPKRLAARNAHSFQGQENFFGEAHPLARAAKLETLAQDMQKA